MSFLRKLARRKAPPSRPAPSCEGSATDLATSDDIATHAPLPGLPSTEGQQLADQTAHHAPDRSGHRYDGVHTGGESRNHLGDVYNKHVTYNYGASLLPLESTRKQREDEGVRGRELAQREVERRLEEEKEHARWEFLGELEFDAMGSRQATVGLAHTDTCTWLVEAPEYVRWLDESCLTAHHGVLWIKGNPGSGKSTLMKYALGIAQERDDGEIIASFLFNARGQPLEKCAEGMYRSLLYQVLSELPHLYSDQTHIKQRSWSAEMLANMLQITVLALKPDEHLILYVDALDECAQEEVRDVVGRFEELVDLAVSRGLRFSICFSSRHYPHITMHKFEELKLDKRTEHVEDISKYVHSNMKRLSIPLSAKDKIEADIKSRSSGIFLWAVLVIKILRRKHDDGAPVSEILDSLATVPDELGSLFNSILANSDKATITAFQWILHARFSSSPQELYFAIKTSTNQISTGQWDKDDADQESIKRFITRSTRGLVEAVELSLRSENWTIQFIHESVREHLLQGGLANLTKGNPKLAEGSAHAEIARCCLSYLQLDSPVYLQYFEPHVSTSWFEPRRFPLYRYAASLLFYHADIAYRAGALPLSFLSELPSRLLICTENLLRYETDPLLESTSILYLMLIKEGHALAEGLLASCSRTKEPGIVTFGATAQTSITFDVNQRCHRVGWGPYSGPLNEAVMFGKIKLVQQLLHLGAELRPLDKSVCNPIITAVQDLQEDIVELLLKHDAGAKAVFEGSEPHTLLIVAAQRDKYHIASFLLANGADPNYRDELGTSLDYAFRGRHFKMARLLWDAQFPASKLDRTRLACHSQTKEHFFDTATVHRIKYHTEDTDKSSYNSGSDADSSYYFDGDDSDGSDNSSIYGRKTPSVSSHFSYDSITYANTI